MKTIRLGKWLLTISDIKWLEQQAVNSELASDFLVVINKHGHTGELSKPKKARRLGGWLTAPARQARPVRHAERPGEHFGW